MYKTFFLEETGSFPETVDDVSCFKKKIVGHLCPQNKPCLNLLPPFFFNIHILVGCCISELRRAYCVSHTSQLWMCNLYRERIRCSEFSLRYWPKLVRSELIPESQSESSPESLSRSHMERHRLRSPVPNARIILNLWATNPVRP